MVGLLNKQTQGGPAPAMPPAAGPSMPGAGQPGAEAPDEESNVSPEEQEEYNEFVTNGMNLMYSEELLPQVLKAIEGDGNPIEGLANAAAMLVMRLDDSAKEAGREISGDVKYHGAIELMEQMIELAQEAGIHEYSEQDMESALYLALDIYRTTRQEQGELPEEELQGDMQDLMAAEKEGRLDEVLPGISQYASRAQGQPPGQPPAAEEESNGLLRR